jgi:hypothetical protein
VQRTTASVSYSDARWNTSVIFGHNKKTEGHSASSWLAESVLQFGGRNYATGRAEIVDKDELIPGDVFRIKALTLGYSRDLLATPTITGALGANATMYSIPDALKAGYGSNPRALYLFVRLRGH